MDVFNCIPESLIQAFERARKRLLFVGGGVRNVFLERAIHDFDLTTDAHPDEIKKLLQEAGVDSIYTVGEKFGTIGALFGEEQIEITTFRSEQYVPGDRHPVVAFGTSLEEDLSRRDFTINAIAFDLIEREMVDPFYGVRDIGKQIIRAVGNPDERFREDPLRMMRAFRFLSQLCFSLDEQTAHSIEQNVSCIQTVSQERVRDELCKLLTGKDAGRALSRMQQAGLLREIVPELDALVGVNQAPFHEEDAFEHTMLVVDATEPENLILRLAALFHDIAKPITRTEENGIAHFLRHEDIGVGMVETIFRRLCFDNETIRKVKLLVSLHMRINTYKPFWSDLAVRKLVLASDDVYSELVALSRADRDSDLAPEYREQVQGFLEAFCERVEKLNAAVPKKELKSPLTGDDLMLFLNRKPGQWIKAMKEQLTERVLSGELEPGDSAHAQVIVLNLVEQGY